MATQKTISGLTPLTAAGSTDDVPIVDNSGQSGVTKRITIQNAFKSVPAGQAATPGLAFAGDVDTGISRIGADQLALCTGGQARLTVGATGDITIGSNLIVDGTTTTISSETLLVEDKNIELGTVASPSDTTADNGGITLKGASDKTIKWINSTGAWTFNQPVHVQSGSAGTVTANTGANDLVVENSGDCGVSILTADGNNTTALYFGNATDPVGAAIRWSDNSNEMKIGPDKSGASLKFTYGDGAQALNITSTGNAEFGSSTNDQLILDPGSGLLDSDASKLTIQGRTNAGEAVAFEIKRQASADSTAASTHKLKIDYAGNFGIGSDFVSAGASGATLGAVNKGMIIKGGDAAVGIRLESTAGNSGIIEMFAESDGASFDTRGSGYIRFKSASNEFVRITSSGLIGINENNPGHYIDMNIGTTNIGIKMTSTDAGAYMQFADNNSSGETRIGAIGDEFKIDVNSDEKLRIDNNGTVFIGGTSTAENNHANINANGAITVRRSGISDDCFVAKKESNETFVVMANGGAKSFDNTTGFISYDSDYTSVGNNYAQIVCTSGEARVTAGSEGTDNVPLVFRTASSGTETERMRIAANGESRIFSSSGTSTIQLHNGSGSGTTNRLLYGLHSSTDHTDGTAIYSIFTNGTVGTPSDVRLKKNIETTRDGYLSDLASLRVVKYNWKTQEDTEPKELGLIAQEVEEVFPGLIHTEGEGDNEVKEIKRSVIPYMLLKALQEANAKIESLETRIAALES